METQRFVQQNAATSTHSPVTGRRSAEAPVGKTRSIEGRAEVRVDPAQNRVRAPRSRAEQLSKFVAQFQVDTARNPGNVGAELAGQAPMTNRAAPAAPAVREGLAKEDQQKVEEAIRAVDRGRRQFSHAAGMSRKSASSIQSVKTPYPTSTKSGIVSTVSEAIASEVNQAAQPRVAPVAAIRQPFFAHSANAPNVRPEVVFGNATTSPANHVEAPPAFSAAHSANSLTVAEAAIQTAWEAARLDREPMTNLAVREKQDTEVVVLPESLLQEIADQHREFEEAASHAHTEPRVAEEAETANDGSVSSSISVDLAAWDVEAFRWSQVTDDILAHASPVMDQLTHYSLDILTGTENRIAVAGLKRGQGTSTISAAVSRWAVANGKRVLLVDADLGNPQLSRSVGLSPNVSWLNLIREDLIPSEAIIRSKATGVCIMPLAAVVTPQTWPGHIYDRLGGLIEQVRHGFDLVVMDVGPVGQLSNELSNHALMLDALMIVDENPSSGEFLTAKSHLLKSGVRKFIAAQNSVGPNTI